MVLTRRAPLARPNFDTAGSPQLLAQLRQKNSLLPKLRTDSITLSPPVLASRSVDMLRQRVRPHILLGLLLSYEDITITKKAK